MMSQQRWICDILNILRNEFRTMQKGHVTEMTTLTEIQAVFALVWNPVKLGCLGH